MTAPFVALVLALPWWIVPVLLRRRLRTTPSLDRVTDAAPANLPEDLPEDLPRVSIVLPARNEATNIEACVRSLCASSWPNLEIVVVDDHSGDGTARLARAAAGDDARFHLVEAPDLPPGWFGKQWACQSGAAKATGSLLLFTDADTRHAPDLVARLVALRAARHADLMSVAGRQEMVTVWERAVQPAVFTLIMARYGGGDQLERARHVRDVVANGQCFMISRPMYERLGGHAAVRAYVAEDLMMAQAVLKAGGRVSMGLGIRQLQTRMYEGLRPLMKGWGKNLYAGGRHAMWGGAIGQRVLYPVLLLAFPLAILAPFVGMAVGMFSAMQGGPFGVSLLAHPLLLWSVLTVSAVLAAAAEANHLNGDPRRRALYAPLGGAILLVICIAAIVRGDRVEWKGRTYTSG